MTAAARLMVLGVGFAVGGLLMHALVDWEPLLHAHPLYLRPLRSAVAPALNLAGFWGLAVPGMLLAASGYRFATARSGRATIVWKLFAYFTLWGIASFAFFFGLFLAYAAGTPNALLVPALFGCLGYILLGLGFFSSTLRA